VVLGEFLLGHGGATARRPIQRFPFAQVVFILGGLPIEIPERYFILGPFRPPPPPQHPLRPHYPPFPPEMELPPRLGGVVVCYLMIPRLDPP